MKRSSFLFFCKKNFCFFKENFWFWRKNFLFLEIFFVFEKKILFWGKKCDLLFCVSHAKICNCRIKLWDLTCCSGDRRAKALLPLGGSETTVIVFTVAMSSRQLDRVSQKSKKWTGFHTAPKTIENEEKNLQRRKVMRKKPKSVSGGGAHEQLLL